MRALLLSIASLGLMLTVSPLSAQSTSAPAAYVELPDVSLPPELDRVLRDYEHAWNAGDASALAALFAEDGFVLQSNRPPVRGRAGIKAAYASQGQGGSLRLRALAYATTDTIGHIIGAYRFSDKRGDTGKFTLTLRRAAGGPWLIFSDMDNLNASPSARKAPSTPSPSEAPAEGS